MNGDFNEALAVLITTLIAAVVRHFEKKKMKK